MMGSGGIGRGAKLRREQVEAAAFLRVVCGMTHKRIADRLSIGSADVAAALVRARDEGILHTVTTEELCLPPDQLAKLAWRYVDQRPTGPLFKRVRTLVAPAEHVHSVAAARLAEVFRLHRLEVVAEDPPLSCATVGVA